MKQRIFTVLSAMSLVMAVAALFFWIWSYGCESYVGITNGYNILDFGMTEGLAYFYFSGDTRLDGHMDEDDDWEIEWVSKPEPCIAPVIIDELAFTRFLGFGGTWDANKQPGYYDLDFAATCPVWFLSLCFAVLPVLWGYRYCRKDRQDATVRCTSCGYDLRASKDACPECGAPIPVKAG
ncbi:MAG: hypothetical protein K8S99_15045 [Planctomycetes bacterium]|nr:hypothetical protein [Planctomycetota bacterium]